MKQVLGAKKHRRCEAIAGRTYRVCYTSGHYGHGVAECWFGEGNPLHDADWVDYVEGAVVPKVRAGEYVPAVSPPTDQRTVLVAERDRLLAMVAVLAGR